MIGDVSEKNIICVIGARRTGTKQKYSQHSEVVPQQTKTIDYFIFFSFFLRNQKILNDDDVIKKNWFYQRQIDLGE